MTIELVDIPKIFILALLELVLSADNATVLALLSRKLPEKTRHKALFIGSFSALFIRAAALFSLTFLLRYQWMQLIGAIYLLYLAISHFFKRPPTINAPTSLWKTIFFIEFYDLVFALDSMIAGIAFINGDPDKLWIVYLGGMIGLFGMRYLAAKMAKLLQKYPKLETFAYLFVALIGLKLLFPSLSLFKRWL